MAEEKKQYVLYDYLMYFWSKKMLFLIIPIITALIVASAIYVLRHNGQRYTGEARVYTGGVKSPDLTDPDNIIATYSDKKFISNEKNLDVFVSEKGQVKFTVYGKTRQEVQQELDKIISDYNDRLQNNSSVIITTSKEYLQTLNTRVDALKKLIRNYNAKLNSGKVQIDQFDDMTSLILDARDKETRADEKAHSMTNDLVLFEKPKVVSPPTVFPKKTYIPEGLTIGIILGLVFTVAFLMLLKYISDARRYYKHD